MIEGQCHVSDPENTKMGESQSSPGDAQDIRRARPRVRKTWEKGTSCQHLSSLHPVAGSKPQNSERLAQSPPFFLSLPKPSFTTALSSQSILSCMHLQPTCICVSHPSPGHPTLSGVPNKPYQCFVLRRIQVKYLINCTHPFASQ